MSMDAAAETRHRSLLKSVSYRVICIISLLLVTWVLTRDLYQSTSITVVFQTIQTFLYYAHERAWANWWPVAAPGRSRV